MDASINFLNVGNSSLCTEGNICGIVAIHIIKRTVENKYTNILHS